MDEITNLINNYIYINLQNSITIWLKRLCKNINIKYLCKKPSSKKCNNQWTVRREPSLWCHLKLNSWVTQAGKMVKPIAKHPHAEWPCKRYSTHTMLSVCAKNILQSVHCTKTKAFPTNANFYNCMLWVYEIYCKYIIIICDKCQMMLV